MKTIDKILMILVAGIFAWMLITFICDAVEANRPAEQAVAHSVEELPIYYGR